MNETPQQYIARITGILGERDPLTVMEATPGHLRSLVTSATPDQLTWTSAPTRWSIAKIAAHLADTEIVGAWRFRSVLGQDNVPIQGYDQDVWESAFHYEQVSPVEAVALFEALRKSTLRVLRAVDKALYKHTGHHTERGPENIPRLLQMYAGHDLNHLGQIERLLEESRIARAAR